MSFVRRFELFAVELPFRRAFPHAAATRASSSSLFLKCVTDDGTIGYGETLPRPYVTGETLNGAFELLGTRLLPKLLDKKFSSLEEVTDFLGQCDGKAPADWLVTDIPQTAAWSAIDLALLDSFGRSFGKAIRLGPDEHMPEGFKYSAVISSDRWPLFLLTLLKARLYGFRTVKVKVGLANDSTRLRVARSVLGRKVGIRVDANMAWTVEEALRHIHTLSRLGIRVFEQPTSPQDLLHLTRQLPTETVCVMADESLFDRTSLEHLIQAGSCRAANIRIAKCGGLIASYNRCQQALAHGFTLQIGCQVGESSLLSAANLLLVAGVRKAIYGEGCYGTHLLSVDPARPLLEFGYGGRPPRLPSGTGLGISIDETTLSRWTTKTMLVGEA